MRKIIVSNSLGNILWTMRYGNLSVLNISDKALAIAKILFHYAGRSTLTYLEHCVLCTFAQTEIISGQNINFTQISECIFEQTSVQLKPHACMVLLNSAIEKLSCNRQLKVALLEKELLKLRNGFEPPVRLVDLKIAVDINEVCLDGPGRTELLSVLLDERAIEQFDHRLSDCMVVEQIDSLVVTACDILPVHFRNIVRVLYGVNTPMLNIAALVEQYGCEADMIVRERDKALGVLQRCGVVGQISKVLKGECAIAA